MYFYTQVDYGIKVKKNMGVSFKNHSKLQVEGQRTKVMGSFEVTPPTSQIPKIFKIFTFKFLMQSLKQK